MTFQFGIGQSELPWGVAGVASAADVTRVCQEIKNIGANSIRMSALWLQIDPNRNHKYVWTNLDRAIDAAEAVGLEILLIVEPRRSVLPIGVTATTSMAKDYGLLCGAIASRYTGRIKWYEIGNEVNNMAFFGAPKTPSKYLGFLQAAYTNIKAADDDAIVLAGALQAVATGWPTMHPVEWVQAFYDSDPQEWFDGLSMHPYSTDGNFNPVLPTPDNEYAFKNIEAIRAIMDANGDTAKLIYCTEWGYDSMRTLTGLSTTDAQLEAEQAQNVFTHYNILKTYADAGVIADTTWVFMYRDWEQANKKAQNHFGMVHFDYTRKPEWALLRNINAPWSGVAVDTVGVTDTASVVLKPPAFPATDVVGITDSAVFAIPSTETDFVSAGSGDRDTTTGLETILTWTHVVTDQPDAAMFVGMAISTDHLKDWSLYNTLTVTSDLDGPLVRAGSRHISASSIKKGSVHGFGLADTDGSPLRPTVGTHNMTAHVKLNNDFVTSLTSVAANSVLYKNVGSFGGVYSRGSNTGGGTPQVTATSAVGDKVIFVMAATSDMNPTFNKDVRYHAGSTVGGDGDYIIIGDADGATSVTGATTLIGAQYGALAFNLAHTVGAVGGIGGGSVGGGGGGTPPPSDFVIRDAATGNLMLAGQQFRFAGANNAHSTGFVETSTGGYGGTTDADGYHLATHAEIDATLNSFQALGLNVMRSYLNGVGTVGKVSGVQTSLGVFSSANLEPTDYMLQQMALRGMKVIFPLVDNHDFTFGGKLWYLTETGYGTDGNGYKFFTMPEPIAAFKAHISFVLDHVNVYTGVAYKDDPTIMMWETGNELDIGTSTWTDTYDAWTVDIAQYIKITKRAQQLVADGANSVYQDSAGTILRTMSLSSPYVDAFSSHPYSNSRNPASYTSQAPIAASYGKAFFIGEYNWLGNSLWTLTELLTQLEQTPNVAGTALWELIAPLNTWSDGYMMHQPGDNNDMTVRQTQIAAHAASMASLNTTKIAVMETGTKSYSSGTSRSVTFTSANWTPKAGQIVAFFISSTTPTTLDMSFGAGWVNPLGGNTMVNSDAHGYYMLYHIVTAGEQTAGTLTYTVNVQNNSTAGNVCGVVLSGVDTTAPVDAFATAFNSSDTSSHTLPGLTGSDVGTGSVVVTGVCADGSSTTYPNSVAGWGDITYIGTQQPNYVLLNNHRTTAGVNVASGSIAPNTASEYAAITVAFKPAS